MRFRPACRPITLQCLLSFSLIFLLRAATYVQRWTRIGSGSGRGSDVYFLPDIFVYYFTSFVFLLLSLSWPGQHRPVCSSRSDNQQWLQVILWVVLRRYSGQQKTERRQLVAPSRRSKTFTAWDQSQPQFATLTTGQPTAWHQFQGTRKTPSRRRRNEYSLHYSSARQTIV